MASYQWKVPGTFPWDGTVATFITPKSDDDVLKTSIECILFTRVGERVMLRDFGSNIYQKPFDPNDKFLRNEIIQELRDAIARWDDRIEIETVDVVQQEHNFRMSVVFYNTKDPLHTRKQFSVNVGDVGLGVEG